MKRILHHNLSSLWTIILQKWCKKAKLIGSIAAKTTSSIKRWPRSKSYKATNSTIQTWNWPSKWSNWSFHARCRPSTFNVSPWIKIGFHSRIWYLALTRSPKTFIHFWDRQNQRRSWNTPSIQRRSVMPARTKTWTPCPKSTNGKTSPLRSISQICKLWVKKFWTR